MTDKANIAAERERMKRLYESVQAIPDEQWEIPELQLCQNTVNAMKSDLLKWLRIYAKKNLPPIGNEG